MSQTEYIVNLFVFEDGTLAALNGDIRGLVLETGDFSEMREELLRIAPQLLRSNHGLTEARMEQTAIRLVFHDAEDPDAEDPDVRTEPGQRTSRTPRLLWEDDPRLPRFAACA